MDIISEPVEKDVSSKSVEKRETLSKNLKKGIVKKIEKKRTEIRKLQELYSRPETIPDEIKIQVAKKIKKKKTALKKLYSSPKEVITFEKAQKWVAVQVVKVFLGMPIIPGK
jgi:seryl-tRNA synthetase